MTKDFRGDPQQDEAGTFELMRKMSQQLTFLERKIDLLISQSSGGPAREKSFSKFSGPSERPYRPNRYHEGHSKPHGERGFYSDRPFEKRQREGEGHAFGHVKKDFSGTGEHGPAQGHSFKKRYSTKKREGGPVAGKKFSKRNG